jgi:hypothetical protein
MIISTNVKSTDKSTKWEIVYEDEETISVWKYNTAIFKNGPISTEIKYKNGFKYPTEEKKKTLGELVQESKKQSRLKK